MYCIYALKVCNFNYKPILRNTHFDMKISEAYGMVAYNTSPWVNTD